MNYSNIPSFLLLPTMASTRFSLDSVSVNADSRHPFLQTCVESGATQESEHAHYIRSLYSVRTLFVCLFTFSMAIITWNVAQNLIIEAKLHRFPSGAELGNCGKSGSIEDARAHGCVFDAMSYIWVRPECLHSDLIENFFNRTDWAFYRDPKLRHQIPTAEIVRGDHQKAFTARKYHSIHCSYMWRKMHKVLIERKPIDSDLASWHHTLHCDKVLTNEYLHEDYNCTKEQLCPTRVGATWTSCGYY
jgi:hypothetical protein